MVDDVLSLLTKAGCIPCAGLSASANTVLPRYSRMKWG